MYDYGYDICFYSRFYISQILLSIYETHVCFVKQSLYLLTTVNCFFVFHFVL